MTVPECEVPARKCELRRGQQGDDSHEAGAATHPWGQGNPIAASRPGESWPLGTIPPGSGGSNQLPPPSPHTRTVVPQDSLPRLPLFIFPPPRSQALLSHLWTQQELRAAECALGPGDGMLKVESRGEVGREVKAGDMPQRRGCRGREE